MVGLLNSMETFIIVPSATMHSAPNNFMKMNRRRIAAFGVRTESGIWSTFQLSLQRRSLIKIVKRHYASASSRVQHTPDGAEAQFPCD